MGEKDPLGVMVVGILGMSGSAVASGIEVFRSGQLAPEYGITQLPPFGDGRLISASNMVVGGWDYHKDRLADVVRRHGHLPDAVTAILDANNVIVYPGLSATSDYPPDRGCDFFRRPRCIGEGAEMVAHDIGDFRSATGAKEVVVVYMGSPSSQGSTPWAEYDLSRSDAEVPSGFMYALGACLCHAHFVDFTPNYTLENRNIWQIAKESGTVLAGRDGSTGQTFMKTFLAEILRRRNLQIEAWYSTNLIGNRDGLVLSDERFAAAKLADKRDALAAVDGAEQVSHSVRIEYIPHWGDKKEAWDAIECRGWLGSRVSVRVNWRGEDSLLAAPLVLDLARLVVDAARRGLSGLQPQFGYFFKRPFLREGRPASSLLSELIDYYVN